MSRFKFTFQSKKKLKLLVCNKYKMKRNGYNTKKIDDADII
jgi:hypothetical protein